MNIVKGGEWILSFSIIILISLSRAISEFDFSYGALLGLIFILYGKCHYLLLNALISAPIIRPLNVPMKIFPSKAPIKNPKIDPMAEKVLLDILLFLLLILGLA